MLSSSYNLNRLGSPIAGDLIAPSIFDGVGGSANYFGTSPPLNMYETTMQSTLPPRRRYSIGGLPSASMTEFLNLMAQNAEAAHLSNLLNETKTSITRSSQILSRGEDLSGDILISSAAGDVIADLARNSNVGSAGMTNVDITGANILNQLPIATNSFSSHPNIYYSQPNYTNSQIHHTDLLSRYKKPSLNSYHLQYPQMYSRPFQNPNTYTNPYYSLATSTLPYQHYQPLQSYQQPLHHQQQQQLSHQYQTFSNKYNQPPPPYSSVLTSHHHRPLHYTSNPAISQSSTNYYFKHPIHSKSIANNAANIISSSASYLHQQNQQNPFSGYSNQHFDLHHLNSNNCYSKLDLDYTKQGEQAKRQVSFNIDVDTLSIDS